MGDNRPINAFAQFTEAVNNAFDRPTTWFRENVVSKNRPQYPWYHQQYRRVPTIDECYTDDIVCFIEANEQYKRDKQVESEILSIMRQRQEDCIVYEREDHRVKCATIMEEYNKAAENWFIKYGDLGVYGTVKDAYMKQKHRLIWERRHGKVGSGMKTNMD
ncbi:NADH dehydrogenase [ubiquinone] 1 beta subcomplex subunit 10-like [Eriocheir sinensis]|uniref:NADH dehydrogenase [ubiquinone] 1 beta subcomplex subunit 10-like n=1 Tax=Eriocheir sinensis TaxID=95602 RepID=UPI0021C922C2|nr:NADH dehydrogenase [ubiquinone] 1 beta subcomplex subunit 10-like [Eriocheir sinensis]